MKRRDFLRVLGLAGVATAASLPQLKPGRFPWLDLGELRPGDVIYANPKDIAFWRVTEVTRQDGEIIQRFPILPDAAVPRGETWPMPAWVAENPIVEVKIDGRHFQLRDGDVFGKDVKGRWKVLDSEDPLS